MRLKALQLVSFAALSLAASSSFASHTHAAPKSAHKPAPAKHAEVKPVSAGRKAAPLPARGRHVAAERPGPRVVSHQRPVAQPAEHSRAEPVPVPDDDIQVRHNRHQHHTAEPVAFRKGPRRAKLATLLASNQFAETIPEVGAIVAPPIIVGLQYDRRGRLVVPAALKGSHEILLHQNEMADQDGLGRIVDDADLDDMRATKLLVPIPEVAGLQTDERLPANRRYCRPWTAQFLTALARAHYARFHSALQVNSAVRTVEFQQRLLMTNGNAAPAEGETASPHLTGQAIDLGKRGLSMTEIAWLRGYLLPLVQAGKVDVEEEFQQSCFHISVYRKYVPEVETPRNIAQKRSPAAALATAIR